MKSIFNMLLCTLLLPFIGFSQTEPECCVENDCIKVMTRSTPIKKGYYAIGDNASQLAANKTAFRCCKSANVIIVKGTGQSAQKGYYAITGNQQKLADKNVQYVVVQPAKKTSKGYYSIGNNHEELPQKLASVKKTCRCVCG